MQLDVCASSQGRGRGGSAASAAAAAVDAVGSCLQAACSCSFCHPLHWTCLQSPSRHQGHPERCVAACGCPARLPLPLHCRSKGCGRWCPLHFPSLRLTPLQRSCTMRRVGGDQGNRVLACDTQCRLLDWSVWHAAAFALPACAHRTGLQGQWHGTAAACPHSPSCCCSTRPTCTEAASRPRGAVQRGVCSPALPVHCHGVRVRWVGPAAGACGLQAYLGTLHPVCRIHFCWQ